MTKRTFNLALAPLVGALAGGGQYALQAVRPGAPIDWPAIVVYFLAGVLIWVAAHELGYSLSSPEQAALIATLQALVVPLARHLAPPQPIAAAPPPAPVNGAPQGVSPAAPATVSYTPSPLHQAAVTLDTSEARLVSFPNTNATAAVPVPMPPEPPVPPKP